MVGPPQPVIGTCVLHKCDLIVVCRELAVLCDDLYLTVITNWFGVHQRFFDFIECFTTTFLRAHSWLNWVVGAPKELK